MADFTPDIAHPTAAVVHHLDGRVTQLETEMRHMSGTLDEIKRAVTSIVSQESIRGRVSWPLVLSIIATLIAIGAVAVSFVNIGDSHIASLFGERINTVVTTVEQNRRSNETASVRLDGMSERVAKLEAHREDDRTMLNTMLDWLHARAN